MAVLKRQVWLMYRAAWDVVTFLQAESALSLVREREDPPINPATSLLESFDDVPDSSIIIRSSDNVNFPVHKSVLAMASPFFKDLLSLPQPLDSENVDGIFVVQLPESAELLNSLISILYLVCTVIPNSYEKVLYFACDWSALAINSYYKVLYLLAACQKYEMVSVQGRRSVPRSAAVISQRQKEPRPSLHMRLRPAKGLFQKWKMQPVRR